MFLQPFQTRHRETLNQMLDNTSYYEQLKLSFTRKKLREITFAGKNFHRHVHARARARVVFTGSTFSLLIFRRLRCFCKNFRHVF